MPRPYRVNADRIDWSRIDIDDFDRAVEAVLVREHSNDRQRARALDGRGGDGGIDVGVWRLKDQKVIHIFQLKYFPEGFSGGFRDARRNQIKSSFERAKNAHRPDRWTLVVPRNPHRNELEFVLELAKDSEIKVDIIGPAELDSLFAKHADIEAAVSRNELNELLAQMQLEKAALSGSGDLQERALALKDIASGRSMYWDTNFVATASGVEEFYTAKHPDAMKYEPIETTFTLSLGTEHAEVAKTVQQLLDFGSFEDLELPPGTGKMDRKGPFWVAPPALGEQDRFILGSEVMIPPKREPITFNLLDDFGYTKGRFEGLITARTSGQRGARIRATFGNCLTVGICLEKPGLGGEKGTFDFKLEVGGIPVSDAKYGVAMMQAFIPGVRLELYIAGQRFGLLGLDHGVEPYNPDDYLSEILDDLAVIQEQTGATFVVPKGMNKNERSLLTAARHLLEGHNIQMPDGNTFDVELDGNGGGEKLKDLFASGQPVTMTLPSLPFEFQNSRINLGPVTVFSRCAVVVNKDEALEAIGSGDFEGVKVKLRSLQPESWWAYPVDPRALETVAVEIDDEALPY